MQVWHQQWDQSPQRYFRGEPPPPPHSARAPSRGPHARADPHHAHLAALLLPPRTGIYYGVWLKPSGALATSGPADIPACVPCVSARGGKLLAGLCAAPLRTRAQTERRRGEDGTGARDHRPGFQLNRKILLKTFYTEIINKRSFTVFTINLIENKSKSYYWNILFSDQTKKKVERFGVKLHADAVKEPRRPAAQTKTDNLRGLGLFWGSRGKTRVLFYLWGHQGAPTAAASNDYPPFSHVRSSPAWHPHALAARAGCTRPHSQRAAPAAGWGCCPKQRHLRSQKYQFIHLVIFFKTKKM